MTYLPKDLEEEAKDFGKRLALLLASANIPDDVKNAWITLIPEMTLEQLDRFANILAKSLGNVKDAAFESLAQSIQEAKQQHDQELKEAQTKALKNLEEIEAMLTDPS